MSAEREQIVAYIGKLTARARDHNVRVALAYVCAGVLCGYDKADSTIEPPGDLFGPAPPPIELRRCVCPTLAGFDHGGSFCQYCGGT